MGYVIFLILFVLGLNGIFDFLFFLLKPGKLEGLRNWEPPFSMGKEDFFCALLLIGLIIFFFML